MSNTSISSKLSPQTFFNLAEETVLNNKETNKESEIEGGIKEMEELKMALDCNFIVPLHTSPSSSTTTTTADIVQMAL